MKRVLVFFITVVFFTTGLLAADSSSSENLKRRNYLGGPDESDLRVQAVLPVYKKNSNETAVDPEGTEGY